MRACRSPAGSISFHERMVSVTQAFAVDLTGQVCTETLDGVLYGGVSTGPAFHRGALAAWRLQASGVEDSVALRLAGHPGPGTVPRWRFDPTPTGFVLEVEEAWDWGGEHWTCRELFRADIGDEGITQLSVYCTGDWDAARRAEHAAAVTLIRP